MSTTLLRDRPAATAAMLAAFDDAATLRAALAFEAALAEGEAACGLIPGDVAARIAETCRTIVIPAEALAEEAALAGTLAIPLVARLRAALADAPQAAAAVHRGATSQDVSDSVLAQQMRAGVGLLLSVLRRTGDALAMLAQRHADVPAVGRTLLQDALPIGFGLRIAQWMAGIDAATARLEREAHAACVVQFGGAAGTRGGLDGQGAAVARHIAEALGLGVAIAPWHTRRDMIAGLAAALGIVIGMLGKMARDVALLAQSGIGEAREPAIAGRGGSSAMAHKRNPTGCQIALSAAIRAPGLVATILSGLPQELERGLGGWQAEGPVIADLFALAAGAAEAMATVAEGLEVDRDRMSANLAALGQGADSGESAALVAALLAARRETR